MRARMLTMSLGASALMALLACTSRAAEVPAGTFSIGNATVGATTLDDVRKTFGPADPKRTNREEEANVTICYVQASSTSGAYVEFETGVMGGYDRITGYRIARVAPREGCSPTKAEVGTLSTANGIRLGQSVDDFRKSIPVALNQEGQELVFKTITKRKATPEELKRLRARWPDEKEDHFDVTISIRAKFRDNQLVDLYVHKIESY